MKTKRKINFSDTNEYFFSMKLTPQSDIFINSSFTDADSSGVKGQIAKSSQKTRKLKQLRSRSYKKKTEEQVDTDLSVTQPQNKSTIENYTNKNPQQQLDLLKTLDNQRKLLSKITIHQIRSQRQNFQNESKKLQNAYNYLYQKLQKEKRKSLQTAQKLQRLKKIQQKSKKQKSYIENQKSAFLQQDYLQKSRIRQQVLCQKKQKEKKVIDFYNNLHQNATQIRFLSNQIDQNIVKKQLEQIEQKKNKYLSQKQKEKNRLLNRQRSLQSKRLKAQNQFKMKWLKQFNQSSKARKEYLSKREMLSSKMLRLYEELSAQNTIQFYDINRVESKEKIKDNLNH